MIQILRNNQRALMLVVAVLTIVAFIFLYNTTQLDELSSIQNPTIYGKPLDRLAIDRQVKNYQLTMALGQYELLEKLGGTAPDQDRAITDYIWNVLVLRHEAGALGILPTDSQVAAHIKSLPLFQTSGQFDPAKYAAFVGEQLTPRGFTELQLEEVVRDVLKLEAVAAVVEAPAALGKGEIESAKRFFQPVTAQFVKFEAAAGADSITVTNEEVAAFHQQNQAALQSGETRDVEVLVFALPDNAPADGKERVNALQKLADAASKAASQMASTAESLEQAAAKAGARFLKLAGLERSGDTDSDDVENAIDRTATADLASAAFLLDRAGATSDVIQSGDAFYILRVSSISPARPLTLDEARDRIEEQIKAQKAQQAFQARATSGFAALQSAVQSGKSFAEAAAAQNLKIESLSGVAPSSEKAGPDERQVAAATLFLKDGELSPLERASWGAFVVSLQSRGEPDAKALATREEEIREGILRNKRDLLFMEWIRANREAARITVPGAPGQ